LKTSPKDSPFGKLFEAFPQAGKVSWLSIRPFRLEPVQVVPQVEALAGRGLAGDHYKGTPSSTRQVTLIQAEHLLAVASIMGKDTIDPSIVRRNIVVQGINLLALKDKQFQIGEAILQMTGLCHPCSRMEDALGTGGYNAMRGHGGITAKIIKSGFIRLNDLVTTIVE
jgi:MOSC domain-containing protein YiiM